MSNEILRHSRILKSRQTECKLGATLPPSDLVSEPIYWLFFLKCSTLGDVNPLSISVFNKSHYRKLGRWKLFPLLCELGKNYLSTVLLSTALSSLYTGKIKGGTY